MQKKRDDANPARADPHIASALVGAPDGTRNGDGMPALAQPGIRPGPFLECLLRIQQPCKSISKCKDSRTFCSAKEFKAHENLKQHKTEFGKVEENGDYVKGQQ